MSEEEIIKYLKGYKYDNEVYQAIQGLLDLYNKEKAKNKNIANDIENYKAQAYMLGRADENKAMKGVIERHYISKDKIKKYKNAIETKISSIELDRDYGRYKRYGGKIKCEKYLAQLYGYKKALQELLEEDNK